MESIIRDIKLWKIDKSFKLDDNILYFIRYIDFIFLNLQIKKGLVYKEDIIYCYLDIDSKSIVVNYEFFWLYIKNNLDKEKNFSLLDIEYLISYLVSEKLHKTIYCHGYIDNLTFINLK